MVLQEQVNTAQITLTTAAASAVRELLEKRNLEDYALRVFVSGGGCSGFQYGMALEGNIRPEDLVTQQEGVTVVVDEISIGYLAGATIDYVEELMGGGFKIENPNAISSCGCGNSFRTSSEAGAATGSGCGCH
jgi:iron-sulfur cluster assembly protein